MVTNNSLAQCARSKSLSLTTQSSTALRGKHDRFLDERRPWRVYVLIECEFSCRRKDAYIHDNDPTLSLPFLSRVPTSPTYGFDEVFEFGSRIILPSALPTPRPLPARIPPVAHDGKSDLDPTEWKPAEGSVQENPGGGGKPVTWRPKLAHRPSSEAYGYLAQFHRSAPATARRGALNGRNTPSLSHTPTTSASSDGSEAGTPTEVSVDSHVSHGDAKTSKRANVKRAELVTPKVASMGSTGTTKSDGMENTLVGEISYDKKWLLGGKTSAAGSLKKLLGHDGVDNTALAM